MKYVKQSLNKFNNNEDLFITYGSNEGKIQIKHLDRANNHL